MKLDFKNKTYILRKGNEYRNYCDDAGGKYPIHGAYKDENNDWMQIRHTPNGKMYLDLELADSDFDLIEVKKTHTITFWVNYYSAGNLTLWPSKETADDAAAKHRAACFKITHTFTEGEGI